MNQINVDAANLFVEQQIRGFCSRADDSLRRVANAKTIMELVRSASVPAPSGYIAWSPVVRRAKNDVARKAEERGMTIIRSELDKLDGLFNADDQAEFQRVLGHLQRDLRYLGGLAPRGMRMAMDHLSRNYKRNAKTSDVPGPEADRLICQVPPSPERPPLLDSEAGTREPVPASPRQRG